MQAGNVLFLLILSKTEWRQIVGIYIINCYYNSACLYWSSSLKDSLFNKIQTFAMTFSSSIYLSVSCSHSCILPCRQMSCDSRHVLSLLILVLCSCCSLPTLEFVFYDYQRITHLLKFHLGSYMKSAWSPPFLHQKLCILFLNSCEILYFAAISYQILQRCIHVLLYGKLSEGRNHIYFLNSVVSTVWCGIGMY